MTAKPIRTKPEKTSKKKKKEKPEPTTWYGKLWVNWIKPIGLAVLIVFTFRSMFLDWNDVPSASMEPTILVGDRIFVNKLAYGLQLPFSKLYGGPYWLARWGGPYRGDTVVFFAPKDGKRMVKRCIGLPGDIVELRNNNIFINGEAIINQAAEAIQFESLDLDPPRDAKGPTAPGYKRGSANFAYEPMGEYLHPVMYLKRNSLPLANWGPKKIPEGKYLMMGDNRNNSRDSRDPSLGYIPRAQIVGRSFGVAFSFDKIPSFNIRWDRFFRGFNQTTIEDKPAD